MPVKKIFSVNGEKATYIQGKRTYVEYHIPGRHGLPQRRRYYGGLSSITDPQEREKEAFEAVKKLLSAPAPVVSVGTTSLLEQTLEAHKHVLRLKTWQTQKSRLKYFLQWLGGRSERITLDDASAFLRWLIQEGKESATVDSYRQSLSGLYRKAKLENVWRAAVAPRVESQSLLYFSQAQTARLSAVLQEGFPGVWLAARLLFACFLRPGEQRLLRIANFDLENGTVQIPAAVSKNGKRARVVIPAGLLEQLREDDRFLLPGDWYLIGKGGAPGPKPCGKNWINATHAKALNIAGIRGAYAFYSWKHTGVVRAVQAGINLKDLQLQLRHHSLDMVNEYLKDLGVMDSEALKARFPTLG